MLKYAICSDCGVEWREHPAKCGGSCAGCACPIDINSYLIVGNRRFCSPSCWENFDEAMQAAQEAARESRLALPGQPMKWS